ncbi:hypothetical protein, partial [Pseudomonas coronafaciens]|uniref:hypothetical protein n=1 Tax=Pseudomonas coronafaciens TaxID=53409 RepID=UPI001C7FD82D
SGLVRDGLRSRPETCYLDRVWYTKAAGFTAGSLQFADKSAPTLNIADRRSVAWSAPASWESPITI